MQGAAFKTCMPSKPCLGGVCTQVTSTRTLFAHTHTHTYKYTAHPQVNSLPVDTSPMGICMSLTGKSFFPLSVLVSSLPAVQALFSFGLFIISFDLVATAPPPLLADHSYVTFTQSCTYLNIAHTLIPNTHTQTHFVTLTLTITQARS